MDYLQMNFDAPIKKKWRNIDTQVIMTTVCYFILKNRAIVILIKLISQKEDD